MLGFGIAIVIKQRETQIEAAQHFHQPLVLQGFRHHDQDAFGRARQQLLMNNHTGFDGFPQTHFVRQQHARRMATAHIIGDMQLMRDQVRPLAAQAAPRHPVLFALIATGAKTQGKAIHTVDLPGKQAVLRFTEHQFAVEKDFTQGDIRFLGVEARPGVGKQAIFFRDVIHFELPAIVAGNGIAGIEHHAGDRGIITGIQTVFAGCREKQSYHTRIQRHHGS